MFVAVELWFVFVLLLFMLGFIVFNSRSPPPPTPPHPPPPRLGDKLGLPGRPVDFADQYRLSDTPFSQREEKPNPDIQGSYATNGLPQQDCYVNVLRDAMAVDTLDTCGIYFGTTGGQVYASPDSGDTWQAIVRDLPAVLSVEVQTIP